MTYLLTFQTTEKKTTHLTQAREKYCGLFIIIIIIVIKNVLI